MGKHTVVLCVTCGRTPVAKKGDVCEGYAAQGGSDAAT